MIQRTAMFISSLVAAFVLAAGLAVSGIGPSDAPAAQQIVEPVATVADAPPQPTVQVDTVYLTPKVKPKVITVKKSAPAAPRGEDGENEGSDD